jgi:hypothetical protein
MNYKLQPPDDMEHAFIFGKDISLNKYVNADNEFGNEQIPNDAIP